MSALAAKETTAAAGNANAFGPVQRIAAGVLDVGYVDIGPLDGRAVLLLHGWPYDIHSYADVAPRSLRPGIACSSLTFGGTA